jgi:hypothetical protein
MSLAHTAEYLKKHGRGPDDQLVHMSSKELKGLQAVAMAHGGSLTINPHTGLPEAGFLDAVLPMVLGAGLMMIPGVGPLAAAGMVGAGYGIAKHDLNAGLMAGLGAYGGAGLASGLGAAGAEAAAQTAGETAATNFNSAAAGQNAFQYAPNGEMIPSDTVANAVTPSQYINPQNFPNLSADQLANMQGNATAETVRGAGVVNQLQAPATASSNLGNVGRGLGALGSEAGRSTAYAAMPTGTLPATLLSASNLLTPQNVPNQLESPDSNPMGFARLSKDFKGYEPQQPNPYYKAQYEDYVKNPYGTRTMAGGGIAFDTGGTVEQMSRANSLGNNNMYPQSELGNLTNTNTYQNPINTPENTSVVGPTDSMTDTYTGAMKFAQGGVPIELHGTADISGNGGNNNGYSQVGGGFGGGASGISAGLGSNNGYSSFINSGNTIASSPSPSSNAYYDRAMQGFNNDQRRSIEQNPNYRPSFNPMQQPQSGSMDEGMVYRGPAQQPMTQTQMRQMQQNSMASGGIVNYASGGHLSSSPSIPDVGIFYDSDLTTKNLPAWNASQAKYKQIAKRANVKPTDLPKTAIEKLGGDFSDTGASGGIATLGSYSDGGRLLKGPGDGMSDNIPAQIGKHQPARLADGEFVVPADVVSHLGNGSTDAGAKKLYSMMDKIRKARTGRKAQGKQINPNKFLPT